MKGYKLRPCILRADYSEYDTKGESPGGTHNIILTQNIQHMYLEQKIDKGVKNF